MRDLSEAFPPDGSETALFLQGAPSPFWRELAEGFVSVGWSVEKIHLAPAEPIFWGLKGAESFSGDVRQWRKYFSARLRKRPVSAVFLYADRQPYHRAAIAVCRRIGTPVYVIENGYLRPDWLTCERGGMGRYSEFPKSPDALRALALSMPDPDLDTRYSHSFYQEAWREVLFHLTNGLTPKSFWQYDHDRYYHPLLDYFSFFRKTVKGTLFNFESNRICTDLLMNERRFYFCPLQMQADYAVRDNSDYRHIGEMIEEVVTSFAKYAPRKSLLVFKSHPYDNGVEAFSRRVRKIARKKGVGRRIRFIETGPFGSLAVACRGMVVINSTSGLHAIRALKPVIALGDAVYDIPGLTHQRGLDEFWKRPDRIDTLLLRDFVRVMAHKYQVKGSFFNPRGRKRAVRAIVQRVSNKIPGARSKATAKQKTS